MKLAEIEKVLVANTKLQVTLIGFKWNYKEDEELIHELYKGPMKWFDIEHEDCEVEKIYPIAQDHMYIAIALPEE